MKENIAEVMAGAFAIAVIVGSVAGTTWLLSAMYYTLFR